MGRARRPVWASLVLISVLMGEVLVVPTSAFAAAYTYACHNPIAYDYQEAVSRGAAVGGTGSDYRGHRRRGRAKHHAMFDPSWPVLLERLGRTTREPPERLGDRPAWVREDRGRGTITHCGDDAPGNQIPADGQLHFVYICNALSGGIPCLADTWFTQTPVIGRRYRFPDRAHHRQLEVHLDGQDGRGSQSRRPSRMAAGPWETASGGGRGL